MKRFALAFLFAIAIGDTAFADSRPVPHSFEATDWRVGDVGCFWNGGTRHYFTPPILQIINDNEMLVSLGYKTLLIRGISTNGLADDQTIELSGVFTITGTAKYDTAIGDTRTVFVFEPESAAATAKRDLTEKEAREKAWREGDAKVNAELAAKAEEKKRKANMEAKAAIERTSDEARAVAQMKESRAMLELKHAKFLLSQADDEENRNLGAKEHARAVDGLQKIIKNYPSTDAAKEAASLLAVNP